MFLCICTSVEILAPNLYFSFRKFKNFVNVNEYVGEIEVMVTGRQHLL